MNDSFLKRMRKSTGWNFKNLLDVLDWINYKKNQSEKMKLFAAKLRKPYQKGLI